MHNLTAVATAASSSFLRDTSGVPGPDTELCGLCLHMLEHTWGESHTIWMRAASMAPWYSSAIVGCWSSWSSFSAVRSAAAVPSTYSVIVHSNAHQTRAAILMGALRKIGDSGHHRVTSAFACTSVGSCACWREQTSEMSKAI